MAELAAIAMIGGTLLSASGQSQAGREEQKRLGFEASQLEQGAGQDRAASQRRAIEERRQARLVQSRAQAVAAASGAGALDADVVRNIADIEGEGEYRALTALYEGEDSAVGKETQAKMNRYQGRAARRAGNIAAMSTILQGASSMNSRYGGGSQAASNPITAINRSGGWSSTPYSGTQVRWDR